MKSSKLHIEHIIKSIHDINEFTKDICFEEFEQDIKTIYAVERCLETMGQSIKDLGDEVYAISGKINWPEIAKMRDILAHHYMVLAPSITWKTISEYLPELESEMKRYLKM